MAIHATKDGVKFGVGDTIRVTQKITEGSKTRLQVFEGMVIGIKGRDINKTFTLRRIGVQQIGIEKIFPLYSPLIEKIEVTREGTKGVRRAKLYYTRKKPKREIDKIYSRIKRHDEIQQKPKFKKRPKSKTRTIKKS